MEVNHQRRVQMFILLGFPSVLELQRVLFVVFLCIYILTLVDNTMIIILTRTNTHLQKPMYLFFSHLSFLETWYISATVPKLLINFLATDTSISYAGCMVQLYFFISLVCTECVLLAVMAYDHYVATCHPLRYPVIKTSQVCLQLAVVFFISHLNFCGPNVINYFFCDISPLLNLFCSIFHISTSQGKIKAFSTCVSHLTVVIIFCSATLFMYARPRRIHSFNINKFVSVAYTIVTPMLNPCIYCLRNQDVKEALKKYFAT
uniref:Olfactory receptor family 6 subfamily B member 1 n=1 Tax=Laticauda laticaudata TaxID=8630 RepID=A0A8C5SAI5_LATLA